LIPAHSQGMLFSGKSLAFTYSPFTDSYSIMVMTGSGARTQVQIPVPLLISS
jgi:hypothetical protein